MVLGLFFAMFGVALLYTLIGISQAVLFRQGLQDGVDAAALSGAVMNARIMNAIVLVNIIMSALLAVLVALKLVEVLAIMGISLAVALAFPTAGSSLSAVPLLTTIQQEVHSVHAELKTPIEQGLSSLHDVAVALRDYGPGAAQATVRDSFMSPVNDGFLYGGTEFPLEDDEYKVLCGKAASFPYKLAKQQLGPAAVFVAPLGPAIEPVAKEFSFWFCGDEDVGPPAIEEKEEVWYPISTELSKCQEKLADSFDKDWSDAGGLMGDAPSCVQEAANDKLAQPNDDGDCRASCGLDGPYDRRVQKARSDCDPQGDSDWKEYAYQVVDVEVEYTWMGKFWKRGVPDRGRAYKEESKRAYCGKKNAKVDRGYNERVHASDDSRDVIPLCSNDRVPSSLLGGDPDLGEVRTVRFTEVIHVLGCMKKEVIKAEVEMERPDYSVENSGDSALASEEGADGSGDSQEKVSQRILPDVKLGGEEFQIRVLVQGDLDAPAAAQIVRLSLYNRPEKKKLLSGLRGYGNFATAQAEYFYDGSDGRDAWMWNMKWRGRLVRFRPEAAAIDGLLNQCGSFLDAATHGFLDQNPCAGFLQTVSDLDLYITH